MTSNGVAFSDLGDPPTHQNHGLYPGRDSCWTLVGDKRVVTGVLRRMLFTRCRVPKGKFIPPRDRRRPMWAAERHGGRSRPHGIVSRGFHS